MFVPIYRKFPCESATNVPLHQHPWVADVTFRVSPLSSDAFEAPRGRCDASEGASRHGWPSPAAWSTSGGSVVRARGAVGGESVTLRVNNGNLATWSLSTSMQDFTATTTLSGGITVAFTNDSGSEVQVDYIQVNGQTRQSARRFKRRSFGAT